MERRRYCPSGLDGRKPGALLKPGRGFERGDLPVEGGELRIGAPERPSGDRPGGSAKGGERVFRGLDRFAARRIGEPRELEAVEVPLRLRRLASACLARATSSPARSASRSVRRPSRASAATRRRTASRASRSLPRVFDSLAVRPVAAVGEDEGARGRGAGSGGGGFRKASARTRRERLGAAGRVVERLVDLDAEYGRNPPGDLDGKAASNSRASSWRRPGARTSAAAARASASASAACGSRGGGFGRAGERPLRRAAQRQRPGRRQPGREAGKTDARAGKRSSAICRLFIAKSLRRVEVGGAVVPARRRRRP